MSEHSGATIAVVDDNAGTRYATTRILQSAGFRIVEAGNGSEALERINPGVDLVVLDVNMPDIDGFEVCRRLRRSPVTAHIPVVHLSATFMDEKDRAHGLDTGADGYLTHPVEPQVLVATVGALLRARAADTARRAADAKLRAVFDLVPTGIAMLDSELKFRDANLAFCTLMGAAREDLIGTRRDDIMTMAHEAALAEARQGAGTDSRWSGILPRHKGRQVQDIEWTFIFEQVTGLYIITAADVTERRRAELERERLLSSERAARSDAQHATRLKDEFLATVSHELRNPLSSILGWTEVLLRTAANAGPVQQGLQAIQRGARLQQQLVTDLLDISAMMAGKVHLEFESVDLRGVIDSALDVVRPAAVAAKVELKTAATEQTIHVRADPLRLQQVLWNLLTNAVKFTPPGGTVTVHTEVRGDSVAVTVQDTGKGIETDFLPYIFDRFRQAETGTSRRVTGLGLGLAIVKQLVDMHGGEIRAASAGKDLGAAFTITLGTASPLARPSSVSPGSLLAGLKIMVVDDDNDHRGWLVRLLLDAGATVQEASDADAALDRVDGFDPDILVSDIGMPGKDGFALIRELRGRGMAAAQLPAIALTAFSRQQDRDAALAAGYQSYITKPVSPNRVLDAIVKLRKPG